VNIRLPQLTLIEWMIIVAILGILAAVVLSAPAAKREKDAFLAECARDHRPYECQVMWKQMHPDPVVVYAPMNR
jgi:hypothetical protein